MTLADNSKWRYQYDALRQVTGGKRYWADGSAVGGQQYEYGFDDIGNRTTVASGGDQNGGGLRAAAYSTANAVNQYLGRNVPGAVDVVGEANASARVMVNFQPVNRHGEYYWVWDLDLSGSMQGAGGVGGLLTISDHVTGVKFAVMRDGNGNVVGLVDSNGGYAAKYEYGSFGELIRATGPMARINPFRFSTKFTDDETDLVYYSHRYYSPRSEGSQTVVLWDQAQIAIFSDKAVKRKLEFDIVANNPSCCCSGVKPRLHVTAKQVLSTHPDHPEKIDLQTFTTPNNPFEK